MDTILSLSNLSISIAAKKQSIIKDISFDIRKGEVVALSGANGYGKSTILRSIISRNIKGLEISGTRKFVNLVKCISQYTDTEMQDMRSKMGYLKQTDDYEQRGKIVTVSDCFKDSARAFYKQNKLSETDIEDIIKRYAPFNEGGTKFTQKSKPYKLSGGQQRLLSIICSVLLRKDAVMFIIDEPLNNLDEDNVVRVSDMIKFIHLNNKAAAFLLVTHRQLFSFVTRNIEIENGRIINDELLARDYSNGEKRVKSTIEVMNTD